MKDRKSNFFTIDEARNTKLIVDDEIACNWSWMADCGSFIRVEKNDKYAVVYSVYWYNGGEGTPEYFATFVIFDDAYKYGISENFL